MKVENPTWEKLVFERDKLLKERDALKTLNKQLFETNGNLIKKRDTYRAQAEIYKAGLEISIAAFEQITLCRSCLHTNSECIAQFTNAAQEVINKCPNPLPEGHEE
jgi:hypothetical protein